MSNEIMSSCLEGAVKEIQLCVDRILESTYCDNAEDCLWGLLKSALGCDDEDEVADIREWGEYEAYQNALLALIKCSVNRGFEIGFNVKPLVWVVQIEGTQG